MNTKYIYCCKLNIAKWTLRGAFRSDFWKNLGFCPNWGGGGLQIPSFYPIFPRVLLLGFCCNMAGVPQSQPKIICLEYMCLEYMLWMSEKYMIVALPQCGEDRENTGNCWIGWDRCLVDIDSLTIWQLDEEKKLFFRWRRSSPRSQGRPGRGNVRRLMRRRNACNYIFFTKCM